MATIKISATVAYEFLVNSKKRFCVLQGAARSSKTWSIIQWVITKCVGEWAGKKKIITISRKTFPALRASVMRDFFEVLDSMGLYDETCHNKTIHEYKLSGNLIEFVAVDQPQKVRGRKRDICWLNEANEFEYEDFFQFNLRTSEKVVMDYNPSDEFHWIYDKILTRDDCDFRIFTYRDNPFLSDSLRSEIERLKDEDDNLWKIYGLGERGTAQDLIYTNWDIIDTMPPVCEHYRYGLDFGYNHPSVLVLVGIKENDLFVKEIIYQTRLTNQDLIDLMFEKEVSKRIMIKADSAEPDRILEIEQAGFKISPVKKSKPAIKDRIDNIKRRRIHITKDSVNTIKEIKNYKWKRDTKTNDILDEPINFKDDAMKAMEYSVGDIIVNDHLFKEVVAYGERDNLPRRSVNRYSLV